MITRFHVFALSALLLTSACGQKGPLTHPPRPPATQQTAPAEPPAAHDEDDSNDQAGEDDDE